MLQIHSPFVEVMKSFLLSGSSQDFLLLMSSFSPQLLFLLTPPPHPPLVVFHFFSSFPSITHFSRCSLGLLLFVLSNFQFRFVFLFCLFFFFSLHLQSETFLVFPLHILSPILLFLFVTSFVVFHFVSGPLQITVSLFAILHHLDCWNYSSLSFSGELWFSRSGNGNF